MTAVEFGAAPGRAGRRASPGRRSIPEHVTGVMHRDRVAGQRAARHRRADTVRTVATTCWSTRTDGSARPGRSPAADLAWLEQWWPDGDAPRSAGPATRPGPTPSRGFDDGLALAIDYGHLRGGRPPLGTLAAFRDGREVLPVPDGSCDLTAHVAADAVAAGSAVAGLQPLRGTPGRRAPCARGQRAPPGARAARRRPGGLRPGARRRERRRRADRAGRARRALLDLAAGRPRSRCA